jgi:hypothetical protein
MQKAKGERLKAKGGKYLGEILPTEYTHNP